MGEQICNSAVGQIIAEMQAGFVVHPLENRCIIATPFLYPDFASIEYSIESVGDKYLLTDNGETMNMLFVNGLTIHKKSSLWKQAKDIANAYNIQLDIEGLSVFTSENNLGESSQNLLGAIQSIGHLLYKRKHITSTTFNDEVEKTLITNEVKYDPNFVISGSASTHRVKFRLNSGKNILMEPLSASTQQSARNKAKGLAYKWIDIRQIAPSYSFITIIDDRKGKWDKYWTDDEAKSPVTKYSDKVIQWESEQDKFIELIKS